GRTMTRFGIALAVMAACLAAPVSAQTTTLYVTNGSVDDPTVKQIPVGGGSFTNYATGFNLPVGLSMRNNGMLYVGDQDAGTAYRVPVGGLSHTSVATGLNSPIGVAVDANGTVYVAEPDTRQIIKITSSGSSSVLVPASFGLQRPYGVALDSTGTN